MAPASHDSEVSRALDRQSRPVQNVGVDHGGGNIRVAEQRRHGPDVVTGLQEVGGKGVALMPSSA